MTEPSPKEQQKIIDQAMGWLLDVFTQNVRNRLLSQLGIVPPAIRRTLEQIEGTQAGMRLRRPGDGSFVSVLAPKLTDVDYSIIRSALLRWRRERATQLEKPRAMTTDSDIIKHYDDELEDIQWILDHASLQVKEARIPRITDYMSIHTAETAFGRGESSPPRTYNQKFKILLSADTVARDFEYYREECELRGLPIALAYVDIDDFKPYNTEFGHEVVDRDILPQFQNAIDAHMFFRGNAYLQGGDECILILPNMSEVQAKRNLKDLQARLAEIEYRLKVSKNPTVSIGLAIVPSECTLTTREIRAAANKLLRKAKETKNTIVCRSLPD